MEKTLRRYCNILMISMFTILVLACSFPVGAAGVWIMRIVGVVAAAGVVWTTHKLRKEMKK